MKSIFPVISNPNKLGHYAGFSSRLVAVFIDAILITTLISLTTWFLSVTATMLNVQQILGWLLANNAKIKSFISTFTSPSAMVIYSLSFIILYNVFFISVAGQTPGKALMGVRVVPLIGGKMSFWRAMLRYVGYYISGAALGLGFLWTLVDDRRMAWHDHIARTCVIYAWDARPDERFLTIAQEQLEAQQNALDNYLTSGADISRDLENDKKDLNDSSPIG